MHSLASNLEKQKWFRRNGKYQDATYTELEKAGAHQTYLKKWRPYLNKIEKVLGLLGTFDPERCGIVSTLYAAWNDLLIEGKTPTNDQILKEISADRWHEKKERIKPERWRDALQWMRDKNLAPTGFGKHTVLLPKK